MLTKVSGAACFAAGTYLLLGDGTSKPIEDITVGDHVFAADPETGEAVAAGAQAQQAMPTSISRGTRMAR